eukprot:15431494-Alexandrium_andersonii.AAC.1
MSAAVAPAGRTGAGRPHAGVARGPVAALVPRRTGSGCTRASLAAQVPGALLPAALMPAAAWLP